MRGLLVGGVSSGCGKTTVTLGLMAALRRQGLDVQGFKVGPDYIDPGLHALVTGRPSWNLDGWMCGQEFVRRTFFQAMRVSLPGRFIGAANDSPGNSPDIGIIEGVMGLFDGASGTDDSGSSAEIAAWLNVPVLLVIDARGMARSTAAVARGYAAMLSRARLAGVICTRVGSANHASLIRDAFAASCPDIALLGCLPVHEAVSRSSRHLGLVTAEDDPLTNQQGEALADWFAAHVDLNTMLRLSELPETAAAGPISAPDVQPSIRAATSTAARSTDRPTIRVAVARDRAFCFIYPALLEALRSACVEPVFFSPLADTALPACAGIWIPGGYPELYAEALAANRFLRAVVRDAAATGMPVYGECGGYIWLMETLETEHGHHAMAGCLPGTVRMGARRAALGYRELRMCADGVFGPSGLTARGHEFHYGYRLEDPAEMYAAPDCAPLWRLKDRQGRDMGLEGCCRGSVAGSWVHVHPDSNPSLIPAFANVCRAWSARV